MLLTGFLVLERYSLESRRLGDGRVMGNEYEGKGGVVGVCYIILEGVKMAFGEMGGGKSKLMAN